MKVLGFEYDEEFAFMRVLYAAPSSDHSLVLSGEYTGELQSVENGIYRDSYVDMETGETRCEVEDRVKCL